MNMDRLIFEPVMVQVLVLLAVGAGGSWIAGLFTLPRVVGGVLAGILLGPHLLGVVAPQKHRYLFLGGVQEHGQLQQLESSAKANRAQLARTGVTETALEELDAQSLLQRVKFASSLYAAESTHRDFVKTILVIAAMVSLLAACHMSVATFQTGTGLSAAGLALGMAAGAGFFTGLLGWLEVSLDKIALLWLACFACPIPASTRDSGDPAEAGLSPNAMRVTALVVLGLLTLLAAIAAYEYPTMVVALGLLWALAVLSVFGPKGRSPRETFWLGPFDYILMAWAGSQVNFSGGWICLWWVLALWIAFAVGKGLGCALAGHYFCRQSLIQSLHLGGRVSAGGLLPLIVAMVLHQFGWLNSLLFTALILANVLAAFSSWLVLPKSSEAIA